MEGIIDFWTIKFDTSELHSFVILSTLTSSTVLETNEDLEETQNGGFHRTSRTLNASVFMGIYILQIFESGIVLLDQNGTKKSEFVCEEGSFIKQCDISEAFAFVEFRNGNGMVMVYSTHTNQIEFNLNFIV